MIVLNEKEYAERCLKEDVIRQDKNPYQVLSILAKYYYHICGYKRKKIQFLLFDYLNKYYPSHEFNLESWEKSVSKLATNAGKEKLLNISGVKITKTELHKIQSINNPKDEQLLFTMLCIAKFNMKKNPKNNGWVNVDTKEIFDMARVSCTSVQQSLKIGEFRKIGLLELPKKNGNLNFRVTFVDDNGDEELFISDFRELGYEYLKYKGENFIRCHECGILIKQNKNKTKKYCQRCSSYTPQKIKKLVCCDCGQEFEVNSYSRRTRCCKCQDEKIRNDTRIRVYKFRHNNPM